MAVYHPSWPTSGCLVHSWHDSIVFNWIPIWGLIQITGLTNSAGQFYFRRVVTSPAAFTTPTTAPTTTPTTASAASTTAPTTTPTTASAASLAALLPPAVR